MIISQESVCHVDTVGDMINNLSVPRSRQTLVEKIMEMGLVGDRRELRRQRRRKDGSVDETKKNKRWQKTKNDLTELADLVSDEHSSSASMCHSSLLT